MRTLAHQPTRQRGLAVITAVLIVAIIATIAAYLGLAQQVWLRQTETLLERAQADSLRQAALDWVAMLLTRDASQSQNKTDHLGELWAKQLPPLPAEGGMIAVAIRDAQGLFNLNNLLRSGNPGQDDIGMFQRLLRAQGLDPALAEALIDWLDTDSNTLAGGAEDVEYLALANPYRAANQLLTSVDELRLVRGFDARTVALRPLVTALPEATATNVNTAIEPVLDALLTDAPVGAWQAFLKAREATPLTEPGKLLAHLPPGTAAPQAPTVSSASRRRRMVHLGFDLTLIQKPDHVLGPLDPEIACLVQGHIKKHGLKVVENDGVVGFKQLEGGCIEVQTSAGKTFPAEIVILAIGVRPDTTLAKTAGLKIGERGGIRVDEHMRTSDPDIFAVGDAIEVKDFVTCQWSLIALAGPANRQGRIAADVICGRNSRYRGTQGTAIIGLLGGAAAWTGVSEKTLKKLGDQDYEKIYLFPNSHAGYYPGAKMPGLKFIFRKSSGKVLGAQALGEDGPAVDKRFNDPNLPEVSFTQLELAVLEARRQRELEDAEVFAFYTGVTYATAIIAGCVIAGRIIGKRLARVFAR